MRIGSIASSSSYTSIRSINSAQTALTRTLARLSSGKISVADDPVAASLAEGLKAQANGYEAANQGLNLASSTLQAADGSLSTQTEDLLRMREIAVQAANGTLGNTERGLLQSEFNSLKANIDSTAQNASFNGQKLLDGNFGASVQAGPTVNDTLNVQLPNTGAAALGLNPLNFDTQDNASSAITAIDAALSTVTSARADIGAYSSSIDSAVASNSVTQENLTAAASNFSDVNYIEEIGKLSLQKVQLQASIAAFNAEDAAKKTILELMLTKKN